jgi:hypothetical protein
VALEDLAANFGKTVCSAAAAERYAASRILTK